MPTQAVAVDGLRLQVEIWGGDRPPLVLLHGLASTRRMFALIAPLLADTFTVIAPDQRGHGESDKPDAGYDFDTVCADLDGLLAALGVNRPIRLAGHSWGAYTALHYAASRPGAVSRLTLIDGGLIPVRERFGETWAEAEARMAPHSFAAVNRAALEEMIRERWLGPAFRPELLPLALSIFDTSNPAQVRAHLPRAQHLQIAHALWAYDPVADLARLDCPTTALVSALGSGSEAPAQASIVRAHAIRPSLDVVWMEDTIHDAPWQRPAEVAAHLRG